MNAMILFILVLVGGHEVKVCFIRISYNVDDMI